MKFTIMFVMMSVLLSSLAGCGSSGTSDGFGGSKIAEECISRRGDTVYVNTCDFAINAIIIVPGATPFRIEGNDSVTQPASTFRFNACRAPSIPVLNDDNQSIFCS